MEALPNTTSDPAISDELLELQKIALRNLKTVPPPQFSLYERFYHFFSPQIRAALRAVVGVFLTLLFLFIPQLSFRNVCLAPILFVILAIMAPDLSFGCQMRSALGTLSGCILSFIFVLIEVLPYAAIRSDALLGVTVCIGSLSFNMIRLNPAIGTGAVLAAIVQIGTATGALYTAADTAVDAKSLIATSLASVGVAVAVKLLASVLVFPSLATESIRFQLASAIRRSSVQLSRHAAAICGAVTLDSFEDAKQFAYETIAPMYVKIAKFLQWANYEQPFIRGQSFEHITELSAVLKASEALTLRVACLASALERGARVQERSLLGWWDHIMPFWQQIYANSVDSLLSIADMIVDPSLPCPQMPPHLDTAALSQYRQQLDINAKRMWKTVADPKEITPLDDMQTLFFVATYTWRVVDGVTQLHQAAKALHEARQIPPTAKWRLLAVLALLGEACVVPFKQLATMMVYFAKELRRPRDLLSDKTFLFLVKQNFTCSVFLFLVFLGATREFSREWQGGWAYVTTIIVFNRTVDATLFKAVLRVVGTLFGAGLAFLIMLHPIPATNPVVLIAWLCVWTAFAVYMAQGKYTYVYLLFLFTQLLTVGCQYSPTCACATWNFAVTRFATVAVGCTLSVIVNGLFFPAVAVFELRNRFATSIERAASLYVSVTRRYIAAERTEYILATKGEVSEDSELEDPAAVDKHFGYLERHEPTKHLLAIDSSQERRSRDSMDRMARDAKLLRGMLDRVRGVLAKSQVTLDTETAGWGTGPFRIRASFPETFRHMLMLVQNLALMSVVINREPSVTGRYHGSAWEMIVDPLQGDFQSVNAAIVALAADVASRIRLSRHGVQHCYFGPCRKVYKRKMTAARLRQSVAHLRAMVSAFDSKYIQLRVRLYDTWISKRSQLDLSTMQDTDVQSPVNLDDIFRLYAYLYAAHRAVSSLQAIADVLVAELDSLEQTEAVEITQV
eukprot:TRINITY_DN2725_c0_g1_i3.p1 TRINITY_DN2725_c0_g1~~TRINITY_DN2725_c0_g1_i3.p1  ORF type:complete len:1017 (+),score=204.20 TRINITY_DN2725_c0_g1_i3:165-3053(+)